MIVDLILRDAPPMVKAMAQGMIGLLPAGTMQELDQGFKAMLTGLANGQDQEVCQALRLLAEKIGIDLNDYRASPQE